MKRQAAFVLCLVLCGCFQLPGPGPTLPPTKPEVEQLSRADVCEQLAAYVAKGRIKTTDDLVRVIGIMKDAGNWTEADSVAINQALPDLVTAKRALTADDASKIKSIR